MTTIEEAAIAELRRQGETEFMGPYVAVRQDFDGTNRYDLVTVDGIIDLSALIAVILSHDTDTPEVAQ